MNLIMVLTLSFTNCLVICCLNRNILASYGKLIVQASLTFTKYVLPDSR